ncbi:class I SAM-dependent methyltransferase [Natrononativus amylolyticus]|uniref:class I SAM-dependent methyltransferase n=1 Tax=Natrononativus amylolyticus TaxID=2963434 RepID=UPI0020CD5056|nr:class I SAM-dependent methyltransferase [Natrononativus amylolyticus]
MSFERTGQPDWDWWGNLFPDPQRLLRDVGVGDGTRVADVCCGDGYFTLAAAEQVGDEPVYATDIDPEMLGRLERLAAERGLTTVEPIEGDARNLPELLPENVDVVLLANVLHGVPEPAALADAVRDVLASDGRFVVINWHDLPREETTVPRGDDDAPEPRGPPTELRLSSEQAEAVVDEAGFDLKSLADVPPYEYHYVSVFEEG